jgi:ABC-type Fe3+-hydroxamate transport system substrate-binding protein
MTMAPSVVVDALGAQVALERPARRVVSLVPSETEAVVLLAGVEVLAGRTDYCVEPRGLIETVPTVGGTKNPDLARILELAPDLVLCNVEENTRPAVEALVRAGVAVHTSFPKTVDQARTLMRELCVLLGSDPDASTVLRAMDDALAELSSRRARTTPRRAFCPIWMDPLMTIHGDTFLSDALDLAGAFNVFNDRPRRYPLAADLGLRAPLPDARTVGLDTRYPRVTLDEVRARAPEIILLPDEPHPFSEADAAVLRAASSAPVRFVSGRDLCWYSPRMGEGLLAISRVLSE